MAVQQPPPLKFPRSTDVSFLADDAAYALRHGRGAHPAIASAYDGGGIDDWLHFKRGLESRRLVPIKVASPSRNRPPIPVNYPPAYGADVTASSGDAGFPSVSPRTPGFSSQPPRTPQWSSKGLTQNQVAALLFPSEARQVEAAVLAASSPRVGTPIAPLPQPGQMFAKPLNTIEVFEAAGQNQTVEPSGRVQALRLASDLAQRVGPQSHPGLPAALTPRAAQALSAPADPATASIVATHQAILGLSPVDVAPSLAELDRAAGDLVKQVGGQCTEQALLIEYLRRHHVAAAQTARSLLQRLQLTVGMYEELRQAMDGSLLQRFQDSLGDAFAALQVNEVGGHSTRRSSVQRRDSPSSPRRGGSEQLPEIS